MCNGEEVVSPIPVNILTLLNILISQFFTLTSHITILFSSANKELFIIK